MRRAPGSGEGGGRGEAEQGRAEAGPASERAEIAARLHSAAIHLLRRVRRGDPSTGLSPARLSALSVLVYGGPRKIGELASAEQVSAPTMTRLVSSLEGEGYVVRERSVEDGRVVIVRATDRAVEALEGARALRVRRVEDLLSRLSGEEWAAVARAVELLESELARPDAARHASPPSSRRGGGPRERGRP